LATRFLTVASGINDMGQIVGYYDNNSGRHGFLYSGGFFNTLDDALAFRSIPTGINSSGHVVGILDDSTGAHGFLEVSIPNPPPPGATTPLTAETSQQPLLTTPQHA